MLRQSTYDKTELLDPDGEPVYRRSPDSWWVRQCREESVVSKSSEGLLASRGTRNGFRRERTEGSWLEVTYRNRFGGMCGTWAPNGSFVTDRRYSATHNCYWSHTRYLDTNYEEWARQCLAATTIDNQPT
jgi:hypothetical protein